MSNRNLFELRDRGFNVPAWIHYFNEISSEKEASSTTSESGKSSRPCSSRCAVWSLVAIALVVLLLGASFVPLILYLIEESKPDEFKYYSARAELTLQGQYENSLGNLTSNISIEFQRDFCREMEKTQKNRYTNEYKGCLVTEIRNGSIIVSFSMLFYTKDTVTSDNVKTEITEYWKTQPNNVTLANSFSVLIEIGTLNIGVVEQEHTEYQSTISNSQFVVSTLTTTTVPPTTEISTTGESTSSVIQTTATTTQDNITVSSTSTASSTATTVTAQTTTYGSESDSTEDTTSLAPSTITTIAQTTVSESDTTEGGTSPTITTVIAQSTETDTTENRTSLTSSTITTTISTEEDTSEGSTSTTSLTTTTVISSSGSTNQNDSTSTVFQSSTTITPQISSTTSSIPPTDNTANFNDSFSETSTGPSITNTTDSQDQTSTTKSPTDTSTTTSTTNSPTDTSTTTSTDNSPTDTPNTTTTDNNPTETSTTSSTTNSPTDTSSTSPNNPTETNTSSVNDSSTIESLTTMMFTTSSPQQIAVVKMDPSYGEIGKVVSHICRIEIESGDWDLISLRHYVSNEELAVLFKNGSTVIYNNDTILTPAFKEDTSRINASVTFNLTDFPSSRCASRRFDFVCSVQMKNGDIFNARADFEILAPMTPPAVTVRATRYMIDSTSNETFAGVLISCNATKDQSNDSTQDVGIRIFNSTDYQIAEFFFYPERSSIFTSSCGEWVFVNENDPTVFPYRPDFNGSSLYCFLQNAAAGNKVVLSNNVTLTFSK